MKQVWISILELPNNKSGYICLRSKKSSPAGSLQLGSEFISSSSLNPSETKKLRRVYQAIHTHCPSLRQFPDFNVENFMQPFAALLASHELICFEVILTILGKCASIKLNLFFVFIDTIYILQPTLCYLYSSFTFSFFFHCS